MNTTQCQRVRAFKISNFICTVFAAFVVMPIGAFATPPPPPPPPPCDASTIWGDWSGSCPYIITNGAISPTAINQCGITGPIMPTNIIFPVYSPTNIWLRIGTNDCTGIETNTENITYSVSGIIWTNFSSPYTTFPSLVTNDFSADADVYVTSSDTTNCPSRLMTLARISWHLPCPTITRCSIVKPCADAGYYGASIGYNFECSAGWYSWEKIILVSDTCGTTDIDASTNADFLDWEGGDRIYNPGPPGDSCTTVTSQTIYFAPVGGGGVTNDNSTCSFNNTQTITVVRTNSPPSTPHGIIITSVTIGGGTNAVCTY